MRFIAAIDTRIYGVAYAQGGEVDTSAWTRKQMLQFLGNGLIQASQITAGAIQDALTFTGGDVTTTVDAQGKLVVTIETQPKSIDWLTDVDTTTDPLVDGQVLVWDELAMLWRPATLDLSGASISIANLSDVDVAGAVDGQVLTFDAGTGHWVAGSAPLSSLVDLLDVDTSGGLNDGDVLIYDYTSGTWIPGIVTGAMGPAGPVCWSVPAPWSSSTPYTTGPPASVVTYLGSAYVCIQSHTNVVPTNGAYWRLLVAKGDKGDTGDTGPASTIPGPGVAAGGTTGQHLVKTGAADYATGWADSNDVPTGTGTTGQVLTKGAGTTYSWADAASGLPAGGTAGQVLAKDTATDYDVSWQTPSAGSVTAGDVDSTGATNGEVLTADGVGGAIWAAPPTARGLGKFRGVWSTYQENGVTTLTSLPGNASTSGTVQFTAPVTDTGGTAPAQSTIARVGGTNAPNGAAAGELFITAPADTVKCRVYVATQGASWGLPQHIQINGTDVVAPANSAWQLREFTINAGDVLSFENASFSGSWGYLQVAYVQWFKNIADPYMTGDYVLYQGRLWVSDLDDNSNVPGAGGWTVVDWKVRDAVSYSHTGTLSVVSGAHRLYNDSGQDRTLLKVRASVGTSPSGSAVTVNLKKGGVSTGASPSIAAGANTATAVPTTTLWADGEYLTVDITAVGSTTPGADLTTTISYTTAI